MAVLRHLIARLSAETSGFESGMARARSSITKVRNETLEAHKAFERQMATLRRNGEVFKAAALEQDFLTQQETKAAWATQAHAKQAQHLTRVLEELARAESNSTAIALESATARTEAAAATAFGGGITGGLKSLKGFAKLAKGGAILAGVSFLAHEVRNFAKASGEARDSFERGEISVHEMELSVGKNIPLIGRIVSLVDDVTEGFTGARAEAQRMLETQTKTLEKMKEAAAERKKEREELREFLKSEKERAKEAAEAGEEYRQQLQDAREADRKRRVAETVNRVGGADERFREEQRLLRIIAEENDKQAKKDLQKSSRRTERSLQSSSFGSSSAAESIARAMNPSQQQMLSTLKAIQRAVEKKPQNTLEVRGIN